MNNSPFFSPLGWGANTNATTTGNGRNPRQPRYSLGNFSKVIMGSLWSFLATHIDLILLVLKDTGYVAAGISVIYGVFKWVASAFHTVRNTNANLELLMTNHLPHIQTAVDAQGESLRELKSDVRDLDTKMIGMDTRISDTKAAVHTIGESFLRHLENVSKEAVPAETPSAVATPIVAPRRRRRAI